jgi:hypothetical protein
MSRAARGENTEAESQVWEVETGLAHMQNLRMGLEP